MREGCVHVFMARACRRACVRRNDHPGMWLGRAGGAAERKRRSAAAGPNDIRPSCGNHQTERPGAGEGSSNRKGHTRKEGAAEQGPSNTAARYFDRRLPTHGADRPTISAVPRRSAPGEADASATRTNVGTFSLGVETDTNYKPRTPFNPDASEMGYDATYVPHRMTVPFIGFSATSILPP